MPHIAVVVSVLIGFVVWLAALTGIIGAFLASGMEPFKAARLGVYIHGLSGDIAAKYKGEISLRATDLLEFLPQAFRKVYK